MLIKLRLRALLGREPLLSVPVTALLAGLLAALLAMLLYKLGNPQHQLKAGLAAIALVVVVVAAMRPRLALGVVLALLPFEFHVFGVGTDEALIFGVAIVLAWRIEARRIPVWVAVGGTALVAGSFLTLLNAPDRASALWGTLRWVGVLILLAEAFTLLHDQPDGGRRLVDIVICSAVVVVFFGMLQNAGIYVIVGAPYQTGNIQSFLSYYTNYGGYVAMVTILAIGELVVAWDSPRSLRAVSYAAAVVFLLLGVAISSSRGALLSLAVGCLILLALTARRTSILLRALALLAVVGAAAYVATPSQTRDRIVSRFSAPPGSQVEDQQRFGIENLGLQALERNPLGIGYNNFRFYAATHPTSKVNLVFAHSQNLPLQMGLDAGWLGLAGFLLLFVGSLAAAIRAGPWGGVRNIACAAALAGFMAQGLFDYLFYDISLVALFAALVWGTTRPTVPSRRAAAASSSRWTDPGLLRGGVRRPDAAYD